MKRFPCAVSVVLLPMTAASAQFAEPVPYNLAFSQPFQSLAIDIDLDGDDDVFVADENGQRLRRFETLSGGLAFREVSVASDNSTLRRTTAIDLDGDGDEDLVASSGGTAGWYENLGGRLAGYGPLTPPLPTVPRVLPTDLDGDGLLDLVLIEGPNYLWSRGTAPSTFEDPAPLGVGAPLPFPRTPSVLDLDVDGDVDLLVLTVDAAGVGTFMCLRNDGALPAMARVDILQTPMGPSGPRYQLGDINGDGLPDLVVDAAGGQSIALNQGGLNFGPLVPTGQSSQANSLLSDVDGDGDLDMLRAGSNTESPRVLWNSGGVFSTATDLLPSSARLLTMTLGDVNSDGIPDLFSIGQDRIAQWSLGTQSTAVPFQPIEPPIADTVKSRSAVTGDFDGNGQADFVLVDNIQGDLVMFSGTGRVRSSLAREPELVGASIVAGDVDGDGAEDLVMSTNLTAARVMRGRGDGAFFPAVDWDWSATFQIWEVADLVDFDGDGDVDLLLYGNVEPSFSPGFAWSAGDGTGAFADPIVLQSSSQAPDDYRFADVNGDGAVDLLASLWEDFEMQLWLGTGGGVLGPETLLAGTGFVDRFELADLDGDGDLDLVADPVETFAPEPRIFEWNAGGYQLAQTLSCAECEGHAFALDVDVDGDLDICMRGLGSDSGHDGLFVATQSSPFTFDPSVQAEGQLPRDPSFLVADLEGDGDNDILWFSWRDELCGQLQNAARGPFGEPYCGGAVPNSTGRTGRLAAIGTDEAAVNALRLVAADLPLNTFVLFAASQTQGAISNVPNSVGLLCLGGSIARFNRPGQLQNSGPLGRCELEVDLTDIPGALGSIAVSAGQTWNFQAWHRDTSGGVATSNFTAATSILWR